MVNEKSTTKKRELTEKILAFIGANAHLPIVSESGVIIRFQEDENGVIHILLEVCDDTALQDIERSWGWVREWRNRLREWQGCVGDQMWLVFEARRIGYARLARALNEKIERLLREYYAECQAYTAARPSLKTMWDFYEWQRETGCYGVGLDRARMIMRFVGINEADCRQWIDCALQNIARAEPAFPPDAPITRNKVREKVRYLRRRGWEKMG